MMRSRLVAGGLLALTAWSRLAGAEVEPRKGPYLQHVTSTSLDVKIELTETAAVTLSVAPVVSGQDAASRPGTTTTITSAPALFHTLHAAGLTPSTRYRYVVQAGRSAPREGTVTTAPIDTSHEPFTFVAFGDNRSDAAAHARVVQAFAKESFDFLVNTGDFVIEGADEAAWQSFFDVEGPVLRDRCLFACIGNHELHNDKAAVHFQRFLGATEPSPADPTPPMYGSFRWGRTRFFLLNAFEEWAGHERAWLEGALTSADHEDGVDLRVAVIHHGPWSAGPHGNNQKLLDAHIDALLVAHHVDLVLAGHDHIYERGEAHGLKYIITGGGGAPLYRELNPVPSTRKLEAAYNFVLTTVTDEKIETHTKRADGSTLETCSFVRGGPWLCDAKPPSKAPSPAPAPSTVPLKHSGCDVVSAAGSTGASAIAPFLATLALAFVRRRRR